MDFEISAKEALSRATKRLPLYSIKENCLVCPSCNSSKGLFDSNKNKNNFCQDCGQKIDWITCPSSMWPDSTLPPNAHPNQTFGEGGYTGGYTYAVLCEDLIDEQIDPSH